MKTYLFSLDHFGLVASPLIQSLIKQTGDKRGRKSALNALRKLAKLTGQIPKDSEIESAGLHVDSAGQIWLLLVEKEENEEKEKEKAYERALSCLVLAEKYIPTEKLEEFTNEARKL